MDTVSYNNMRFSELIPLIILSSALFLLAMPFFDETNPTGLSSFSAQSGQGCIDLEDSSTWHNNITSIGNRSFFLNDNVTLCKKTYLTDTIHDFFVFNGSYVLDCNGSTIRGSGLGKGVLSRFNNTFIENCVFENFGTDLNILDIDENAVPNAIWNVTQNTSSQNESAFSVVVDQNGYFIVAGYDSPTGINNSQWRVVKLDKDGNVLWNWTQDPSSGIDLARSVVVDQDGNYIIAGSENLSGESQWRVVKMNKNSVVLWNFTMNVSNGSDEARSVVVDQDGNYLVVGIGGEDSYWFAVKLDKDGNVLWNWTQNASPNDDEVFSVVVDHDNNYILAGNDKVSGVNKLAWRVVKLNKSGNVLWNWTHHFSDNESAYSVVVDLNGNYVIAGYDDSFGADDLGWRVVKLDKDGNVLWNWTQDPSSGIDLARSVVVDQDGNYLIAGGDAAASDEGLRVVKLNVSGDALWNWTQNPSAKNDSAVSICVDSKGDYVVAGFDGSPAGSDSQWRIVKLSADKNALTGISLSNVSIFDDDSSETFVSLINTSATLNNFTIGYNLSVGKINYAHLSGVQGVLSLKRNIIVNPYFVSLDSSKSEASAFNSSANLTLDSNFSSCFVDLFKADGFLSSRNEILANGSVVNPSVKSCVDGRVVFSTVGAFSGYALKKSYDGCIDLFNSSTFKSSIHDKIFNVSNRSFFLNDNVALCKKTYLTDTIHDFFIFNGSYVLDCNGSTIRGSGLGKGALSVFNGSRIQNCVFQNFKCGLNILNIEKHNISTVWNWTKSFSSNIDEDLSVAVDREGNYVMAGADGSFGGWTYEWRVVKIDKNGNILWNFSQNSSAHPYDEAEDVVVDQDGNYLIVGRYLEGSGLAWKAVKVNPDGVILWNWTQDPSSGDDTA
ncbi:hypothetical protein DRJ25_03725 [Candidatus Woesearchaeota archaeon]|nr:MAG: hypothetical protein DRJ25_03725 [Candidatus Woesearchaeota archaeon]